MSSVMLEALLFFKLNFWGIKIVVVAMKAPPAEVFERNDEDDYYM